MSDPYLNCNHCGGQCACRATRDELERYKEALQSIKDEAAALLDNEDGGRELESFLISASGKATAALAPTS